MIFSLWGSSTGRIVAVELDFLQFLIAPVVVSTVPDDLTGVVAHLDLPMIGIHIELTEYSILSFKEDTEKCGLTGNPADCGDLFRFRRSAGFSLVR